MADQDTIWTEVKEVYPSSALIALTNVHNRTATVIDDTSGTRAAEHVLGMWDSYIEESFDATDIKHLAHAVEGTMAVLYRRGGSNSQQANEQWDRVFGDSGMFSKLRRTAARSRRGPGGTGPDLKSGREQYGYSHRRAMPPGYMPTTRTKDAGADDV
jgi:hypothetical protein